MGEERGGVCMNGAKPGASACFWAKGGAGVLVVSGADGRRSRRRRRKEESGEQGARVIVDFCQILI